MKLFGDYSYGAIILSHHMESIVNVMPFPKVVSFSKVKMSKASKYAGTNEKKNNSKSSKSSFYGRFISVATG